ncbi:SGNH/GDSL hydrolase family protein [Micromonospora sp. DT233]|uniref:SGNH/GDSL hydrolase family protein n=1 Tax=Micromonospora sp. DT233 TaxID=3393432 RepID=UPI003CF15309
MRSVRVTAVVAAVLAAALLPDAAGAAGAAPRSSPAHPFFSAHTAGRVSVAPDALRYSWPGVYFEGRFLGTGVGMVLDDSAADYDVQIDGRTVQTLVTPGRITHWVHGLPAGAHRVRLVKRSESPWATSSFGGFVAAPGGRILPAPAPRRRQIEFIGDSHTAGYGNESTTRDCTGDEVNRTTNADRSFGAATARRLHADYQINAYSGRGMVRNYNGSDPGVNYRTFYDRALLSEAGDVWRRPPTWRPQLVVVGLGINDFSTAVNPGEEWTPESLATAYRAAYHGFLDKLRARYGSRTVIVVSASDMGNAAFVDSVRQVVGERTQAGDDRLRFWHQDTSGWDLLGCHWHPSLHDHEILADQLTDLIDTLPLRW